MTRRYQGDTLILETEWDTASGTVRVIDFMPPRGGEAPVMVRIVEGVSGAVEMECVLRVRFGYGADRAVGAQSRRRHRRGRRARLGLAAHPGQAGRQGMAHEAAFAVRAGEQVPFVLSWRPSHQPEPEQTDAAQALAVDPAFWDDWVSRCTYHGEYRDAVVRSLITLKALTYAPTGGIVAAPTTSLPEDIGGVRNWDYRYCWLRDATITLEALLRTGYTEEASAWREWLGRAIAGDPQRRADHVRGGGRAAAGRVGGRLAARLRALGPGPDRQRRGEPAPARRVRRGDRRDGARRPGGLQLRPAHLGA